MKRFLIVALLVATPALAQTDSTSLPALFARVTALEAKNDTLARALGNIYKRCADQLSGERPAELPNREYPAMYRQCQLGSAADVAYRTTLPGFQAQLSGIAARLATVEAAVNGGYQIGTAVFDKIRANKICVGDMDCDPDWNSQIQVRGNYSAVIGLEANLAKVDPQDAQHTHVSQLSVSQDGGTRLQQNAQSTFSRGFVSYVNPCRQWLNFGPDSRSSVSLFLGAVNENTCTPIPHDGAQDLVILPDENDHALKFYLMRPLWTVQFRESSTIHAGDIVLVPKQ